MNGVLNEIYHYLGLKGSGSWYGWWSGAGSDVGEVVLIGLAATFYRQHTCHVKGCWRLHWKQWVAPEGHTHALCRRHHPHDPPTAAEIAVKAAAE